MKWYTVESGVMGYVPWIHDYQLFATDKDYEEFVEEFFA